MSKGERLAYVHTAVTWPKVHERERTYTMERRKGKDMSKGRSLRWKRKEKRGGEKNEMVAYPSGSLRVKQRLLLGRALLIGMVDPCMCTYNIEKFI